MTDLKSFINGLHNNNIKQRDRCTHILDNNYDNNNSSSSCNGNGKYTLVISADPAIGILYVTKDSPDFISGHVRMRGKDNGQYPYKYLEMINNLFGYEQNTIEVCSNSITATNKKDHRCSFTVDINKSMNPDLVADGQTLDGIADNTFDRWRCDPPYSQRTATSMYDSGYCYPNTLKLLKAGARVCKPGALLFLLLGPKNYQMCPPGLKRIGLILITVVPNNEIRALNIYQKL